MPVLTRKRQGLIMEIIEKTPKVKTFGEISEFPSRCEGASDEDFLHEVPVHVGETEVTALILEGEPLVIDAQ